jgi:hypothetical protein
MYIAQQLKKNNIAEYLLYMWQIEDLMRACRLDMEAIEKFIVEKYRDISPQERKQLYEWYESIIEMMRSENVQQSGHIQLNKNIIIELCDFHRQLAESGKAPACNAKFLHILPAINQLRQKSPDSISDIEICFNFMYGIMIMSMKKNEISPETLQMQNEFAKFFILLAENYKLYQNGDLEL